MTKRVYQRTRITTPRPDVEVVGARPLAQLTIYRDIVLLTRRDGPGWRQYPISTDAAMDIFRGQPHSSGVLPANTLAVGSQKGIPYTVRVIAPHQATVRTAERAYTIPLPPLVWGTCEEDCRIWALTSEGWPRGDWPLCVAPFPNTYANGSICWGNVAERGQDAFVESYFNAHVQDGKSRTYPNSIVALWETLGDAYPLDDLVPTGLSVEWLCAGGPWK